MKDALAGLLLTKGQYKTLVDSCVFQTEFPSWRDWNKHQIRFAAAPERVGGYPSQWTINVDDFVAWCHRVGTVACLDSLCAYCLHLQGQQVQVHVHAPIDFQPTVPPAIPG